MTHNKEIWDILAKETKAIPLPVSTVGEVRPKHGVQTHSLTRYEHLKDKIKI